MKARLSPSFLFLSPVPPPHPDPLPHRYSLVLHNSCHTIAITNMITSSANKEIVITRAGDRIPQITCQTTNRDVEFYLTPGPFITGTELANQLPPNDHLSLNGQGEGFHESKTARTRPYSPPANILEALRSVACWYLRFWIIVYLKM